MAIALSIIRIIMCRARNNLDESVGNEALATAHARGTNKVNFVRLHNHPGISTDAESRMSEVRLGIFGGTEPEVD